MQKIKTVLRLHLLGGVRSRRELARAAGCGKSAVSECLRRAELAGLTRWELIEALDEESLLSRLYPKGAAPSKPAERAVPDWTRVREELARRDHQVTLMLLWTEYKAEHPNGYQYSQFTELYRRFEKKLSWVLRQQYRGGEKGFVDFCDGIAFIDCSTGELIRTQLFVGALGASSYTFAHATLSQELPVWLDCHVRMYEFWDGAPALTIPDNLRAAVTRADRYEAEVNCSYRELAEHYNTCVMPARPYRPRDKAKVEAAVLVAQRWLLAALRHRTFYSLEEINTALAELLVKLNDRVMRHVKQSRRQLYEKLDRPALKTLPPRRYQYAQWKQVKVNIDYHISFDDHFYSVPYTLIHETLWCRATHSTVELLHKSKRIASHPRSFINYGYSTLEEHRPASHRAHLQWTPARLIEWGRNVGPYTANVVEQVLRARAHPEQGYRSVLGILRLSNTFGVDRLERACERALAIGSPAYRTIKTMLQKRMESAALAESPAERSTEKLGTTNVRGRRYYH